MTNTDGSDHLRTAYDQLCTSYHAIDDFRAKLLGFLPLVTGGGLILLTGRVDEVRKDFFGPVGLLGIAVTLGLLAYELAGINRCLALIADGLDFETDMKLEYGQFKRPDDEFRFITKSFAAAWIYPAVLAAWTYLALFYSDSVWREVISPIVFVAGFVGILLYDRSLRTNAKKRAKKRAKARAEKKAKACTHAATSTQAPADTDRDECARQHPSGADPTPRASIASVGVGLFGSLTTSRGRRAASRASGP